MPREFDERLQSFVGALRATSERAPGKGAGRVARTLRGAAGMAMRVWSAGRRDAEGPTETELRALEQLVGRLGELKGLPMKIGQILGYLETELPEEARRLLALLQTQSPTLPFERVEQVLRDDLGPRAEVLLAGLERTPASAASIGQVHFGRLPDGAAVAVKIRHPDIEDAIRSDFRGASAGTAFAQLVVPGAGASARDFVAEAQARLLEECDYRLEASRQRTFGALFAASDAIVVPRVHDGWCGPRVLVSSREDGRSFEEFAAAASQAERDAAGRALFDFYVGTLYRHALFHADPHPGNYRFRDDGRIVVFDFGCVREFDRETVGRIAHLAEAVRADEEQRLRDALASLGATVPADPRAYAHVRTLLRGFFAPLLRDGEHVMDGRVTFNARTAMRDKLALARLRLPGKLLFLFRIRFGLYSVLARLGAVCDWGALERGFADQARAA